MEKVNKTQIVLILKVHKPKKVSEFRPISCYNFLYKIISKIIVEVEKNIWVTLFHRIKILLWGGRLIQDNIIVTHEIFRCLKKRDRPSKDGFVAKLDLDWKNAC